MKPDASQHDPSPDYLRALVDQSGLSQRAVADLLGVDPRTMRYYLAHEDGKRRAAAPYCVQYALEQLSS